MIPFKTTALALGALALCAVAACSSSGSGGTSSGTGGAAATGCGDKPFDCPAGQTCWVADAQGSKLECLNSGPGKLGEECKNFAGQPSCADGLICFQLKSSSPGVCTPFCDLSDPAHACPNGGSCFTVSFAPGNAATHACAPPDTGTGGGGAGGGGGSGGN